MRQLSPEGQAAVSAIAHRTGFSTDAVTSMLFSVIAGNGSMAQFNHPEFGGSGQWMRGGMIMVSDMFNNALKAQVDNLCNELTQLVASQPGLTMTGSFQSQSQGGMGSAMGMGMGGNQSSLFIPDTSANWWPSDLGMPASVGAQNSVRYAYFPGARRLVIDLNGHVTTYDTLDHQIGGFGQQQSGSGSFSFTSQYGLVDVASLPVVSGAPMAQPAPMAPPPFTPAPPAPQGAPSAPFLGQSDIMSAIEKLADLHAKGILTEAEFNTKKTELLSRL